MKTNLFYRLIPFIFLVINSYFSFSQSPAYVWSKNIGGNGFDFVYHQTMDNQGDFIATGYFQDTVFFEGNTFVSKGGNDIFIYKYDSTGTIKWIKTIGGLSNDYGVDVATDNNRNIFITGAYSYIVDFDPDTSVYFLSSCDGGVDTYVLKLNEDGEFIWAKSIGGPTSPYIDFANSIATSEDGDVFYCGRFHGTADFDPGPGIYNLTAIGTNPSMFIVKLSSNGSFLWAKSFGNYASDEATSLTVDNHDNLIITGQFGLTIDFNSDTNIVNNLVAESNDAFILKLANNGNFKWGKRMGCTDWARGYSIVTDKNDNIFLCGSFRDSLNWNSSSPLLNLYSTGQSEDAFIAMLDSIGNIIWVRSIGGNLMDFCEAICVNKSGNIYAGGFYRGIADLMPGSQTLNFVSNGNSDIFVLELDYSGNCNWVKAMGSAGYDECFDIICDNNDLYLSGYYNGLMDVDPSSSINNITSNGNFDGYIIKWQTTPNSINNILNTENVKLYPNPVNNIVNIVFDKIPNGDIELELFDISGRFIKKQIINNQQFSTLDISNLDIGVYVLKIKSKSNQSKSFRIIKN